MNKQLPLLLLTLCFSEISYSQDKPLDVKYRRSSLHTMVIESDQFPNKEIVLNAFKNAPFPDKYNDHTIGKKSFNPLNYPLSQEEKVLLYKPASSKMGQFAAAAAEASDIKIDSVAKEFPQRIKKYLKKEKCANLLVAKWFNRQDDGSFDWNLIAERGVLNASFLESESSKKSQDGIALLKTAGFELIGNTFVVVNKFNFFANEPVARLVRDVAKAEAAKSLNGKPQMLIDKSNKAIDDLYEKTKEGYTLLAKSYLYKLVWNDSIATIFFNDMYFEKGVVDSKKKNAFENTDLFDLEFVGDENAVGLVTFSFGQKRTEEQIITLGTNRIVDAVYAKLQKKYDVFKTKTPLYTGYPITAKIGMKEGLEGGEKFDVLEQNMDPKTGVVTYKKLGTIKVDKDLVWDNRLSDGEEIPVLENIVEGTDPKAIIDRTTFKGGKKFYPGLLIKQIK